MAVSRQIEMKEPRVFEDFRLAKSAPERVREVGVVGTAFDSIMVHDMTYVSTPITSGVQLYKVLAETGLKTLEELRADKGFFFNNVIKPNIDNADIAARRILDLKGGAIIAPAAFEAKQLGWGQDEYMGMWFDVIEKKATRIVLLDGWEYSNGAAEEYLQALLMQAGRRDRHNIEVCDEHGEKISQAAAFKAMAMATEDLLNRNFKPVTMATVMLRMGNLWGMVSSEQDHGQSADGAARQLRWPSADYCDGMDSFRDLMRSLRPIMDEAYSLVPAVEAEKHNNSELFAPSNNQGLVRQSERTDLAKHGVKVHKKDDDQQPKPAEKKKTVHSPHKSLKIIENKRGVL